MMKTVLKYGICCILICSLIFCENASYVMAGEKNDIRICDNESGVLEQNDIICYIDGIPIHYYDVDEYGIIKDGVLDGNGEGIAENTGHLKFEVREPLNSSSKRYLNINSPDLKEGLRDVSDVSIYPYKGVSIRTKTRIMAQQIDETYYTIRTYMSAREGAKFASSIEVNPNVSLLLLAIGFCGRVGTAISALVGFKAVARAELATRIRKYTDEGKRVCVIESAGIVGVKEWTGSFCTVISMQATYGSDHVMYEELVSVNVSEE